jgi:hypothetical protein
MKILGEETIDGRECVKIELPYTGTVWVIKRIKGKDAKELQSMTGDEAIINYLIKKTDPVIEGSVYDELDIKEITWVVQYYQGIVTSSEDSDVKKK